jgi:hypothetical protein
LQSAPATNPGACFGTIQDRIIHAVSCQWNVHGGPGGSSYPDKQGTCSATLSCQDTIAHNYPKIPPVSIAWKQRDPNSFCMLDPTSQLLSSGVGLNGKPLTSPLPFPQDLARQVENALQQQYGLMAMDRMAGMLEQVALTGSAIGYGSTAPSCNGCNFGTKDDAPFFVYAVDGSGAVKNYTGFRNQPLPQAAAAGTIANLQALIPGGDKTFYAITKDGKLNWYQFTPARQSAGAQPAANTVTGPVTVASGFNAYKQVFGGSDGVIYAVQNDGTLLWFRHAGFANGGGAATMTGPKPVASGFGQFKNVFSAGSGIIYGVAADGSLLWYRHKNYLTGVADAANAKSTANTKNTANAKNTVIKAEQNLNAPSQLEGPVTVGSGWGNFRQVIPSGAGVVLAVQSDGTLLWYRHDDYLTGVSTASGAAAPGAGTGIQKAAASAERDLSSGNKTLASSWGTPAQAGGINSGAQTNQRPATGTPQWGTQPQVRPVAGIAAAPSSLHGGSEAMQTLHPGPSPSSVGGAGPGNGARQNVGATSALAAVIGTPHWDGPATVAAHSGWEGFPEIAAVLPVTVQTNVIK